MEYSETYNPKSAYNPLLEDEPERPSIVKGLIILGIFALAIGVVLLGGQLLENKAKENVDIEPFTFYASNPAPRDFYTNTEVVEETQPERSVFSVELGEIEEEPIDEGPKEFKYTSESGLREVVKKEGDAENFEPFGDEGIVFYYPFSKLYIRSDTRIPELDYIIDLKDVTPDSFINRYEGEEYSTSTTIRFVELKWSEDEREFWGIISINGNGDPPVPFDIAPMVINPDENTFTTFEMEGLEEYMFWFEPEALNIEKRELLVENMVEGELSLYWFDLESKDKKLVVSYEEGIVREKYGEKYPFIGYQYEGYPGGGPGTGREDMQQLHPEWVSDSIISYIDIESGEPVLVNLNDL